MAKAYESGMRVLYGENSKRVTVAFRGRLTRLDGVFATEALGIRAGEEYCRQHGWGDAPGATFRRSILKSRAHLDIN